MGSNRRPPRRALGVDELFDPRRAANVRGSVSRSETATRSKRESRRELVDREVALHEPIPPFDDTAPGAVPVAVAVASDGGIPMEPGPAIPPAASMSFSSFV